MRKSKLLIRILAVIAVIVAVAIVVFVTVIIPNSRKVSRCWIPSSLAA
jgi:uncharacterized protein YoxC